jgi:hypothetical protein
MIRFLVSLAGVVVLVAAVGLHNWRRRRRAQAAEAERLHRAYRRHQERR